MKAALMASVDEVLFLAALTLVVLLGFHTFLPVESLAEPATSKSISSQHHLCKFIVHVVHLLRNVFFTLIPLIFF
ncbi:hypothetical protein M758_UG222700 [Ceratodon purpureus]|nr:hypothetical protein M758_UG222700 [Ceratodon purpureus]